MADARAEGATAGRRAVIYAFGFYAWNLATALTLGWGLILPRPMLLPFARWWAAGHLAVMRAALGLRYRVEGVEHLPPAPFLIAAKHQSAWETIAFNVIFDRPAFVLKRELFRIPVIGWWLWRAGMIGIDRKAGAGALKAVVRGGRARAAEGRPIVIFPEGTRVPVGGRRPYQPGVAALYADLGLPVVPVALNSGLFGNPRGLARRGGEITVAILPPIPPGLPRREMMARLEAAIESRAQELAALPAP